MISGTRGKGRGERARGNCSAAITWGCVGISGHIQRRDRALSNWPAVLLPYVCAVPPYWWQWEGYPVTVHGLGVAKSLAAWLQPPTYRISAPRCSSLAAWLPPALHCSALPVSCLSGSACCPIPCGLPLPSPRVPCRYLTSGCCLSLICPPGSTRVPPFPPPLVLPLTSEPSL